MADARTQTFSNGLAQCVNKLGVPLNKHAYDTTSILKLADRAPSPYFGTSFTTASELDWLAGKNCAFVGAAGRWEIVLFRDVSYDITAKQYTVSHFIRGVGGTENHTDDHQVADFFYALTWGAQTISVAAATFNKPQAMYGVANGTVVPFTFTFDGGAIKPWSAVNVKAHNSSGDIVLTWNRRDRAGTGLHDGDGNIALSENTLSFQIDIYAFGVIVRTLTATTETVTYTAAMQTADAQTIPMPQIEVAVYQVSDPLDPMTVPTVVGALAAAVGRGYGAHYTKEVTS